MRKVQFFWTLFKRGGGGKPMFKNYVGNCRVFWRSFNNMKFAWKGTFEALMVKFGGEIGTLYQIFPPCTPLPKYKRAFTWFLGGSNSLAGCRRIFGEIWGLNRYIISNFHSLQKRILKNTPCKIGQMFKQKGGGGKGLLNNVQKNCTFLNGWLPLDGFLRPKRAKGSLGRRPPLLI